MTSVIFAGGGTGGHLYPALAIADALCAQRSDVRPHFVGARRGVEARVLPQRGVEHTLLPLQPIFRSRVWRNWRLAPALAGGFRALRQLFRRLDPRLVVGTGGYASAPACAWGVLRGVPVALQEQNSYPGFTTRLLARWARQLHLGFPEAQKRLRTGRRTEVFSLGNPVQPPDASIDRAAAKRAFGLTPDGPVLLVVGGSQGARALNAALLSALERSAAGELGPRPAGLQILWSTGPAHLDAVQRGLTPLGVDSWVRAVGYIDDMPRALATSELALSRAGAIGTAELLAWGIPMLLVPLPTAAADHQTHNARALEAAQAAVVIPERDLDAAALWNELVRLAGDEEGRSRMAAAARARARPEAAHDIARELARLIP